MKSLKAKFAQFNKNESGATIIEYALIAALLSVAAIATLRVLGGNVNATFQEISGGIMTR